MKFKEQKQFDKLYTPNVCANTAFNDLVNYQSSMTPSFLTKDNFNLKNQQKKEKMTSIFEKAKIIA